MYLSLALWSSFQLPTSNTTYICKIPSFCFFMFLFRLDLEKNFNFFLFNVFWKKKKKTLMLKMRLFWKIGFFCEIKNFYTFVQYKEIVNGMNCLYLTYLKFFVNFIFSAIFSQRKTFGTVLAAKNKSHFVIGTLWKIKSFLGMTWTKNLSSSIFSFVI